MAHFANPNRSGDGPLSVISGFFASLWDTARNRADLERRMNQMRNLEAMSDAELADRGIARDRIVYHVFRDIYYV